MPQFKKKPVVIEAFQVPAPQDGFVTPPWVLAAMAKGLLKFIVDDEDGAIGHVDVQTPSGLTRAEVGDWIVQGTTPGDVYPVTAAIFPTLFDPVEP